jgi:hypothetical protein
MKGNPNVVGEAAAFNWTVLDELLADSASRYMHVIFRTIVHFPGKPLMIPQYLLDSGIELRAYNGGVSPYYGDPKLLEALEQFIRAFGKRYDGNKRIGFIQVGLLGFWGEWHTWGNDFIPVATEEKIISWFRSSFTRTKIQIRYPKTSAYNAGFGLHDDSFAFNTLDGEPNGGAKKSYYFWSKVLSLGQQDFYKRAPMGGETRVEIADAVFDPSYPAKGAYEKQPFMLCVNTTKATYIFHHPAFKVSGENAHWAVKCDSFVLSRLPLLLLFILSRTVDSQEPSSSTLAEHMREWATTITCPPSLFGWRVVAKRILT